MADKSRIRGDYVETVGYLVSACKKMAQIDYRRQHDRMGLGIGRCVGSWD